MIVRKVAWVVGRPGLEPGTIGLKGHRFDDDSSDTRDNARSRYDSGAGGGAENGLARHESQQCVTPASQLSQTQRRALERLSRQTVPVLAHYLRARPDTLASLGSLVSVSLQGAERVYRITDAGRDVVEK